MFSGAMAGRLVSRGKEGLDQLELADFFYENPLRGDGKFLHAYSLIMCCFSEKCMHKHAGSVLP